MNILITGGSGLLGSEICKLESGLIVPSIAELDITQLETVMRTFDQYKPDIVLHLAAATNPPEHEKNPLLGLQVNIIGTAHIALLCLERNIRLVYTSSDYLYTGPGPHHEDEPVLPPSHFYRSKYGGECAVALVQNHLIVRLSFGPVPFPYPQVYSDQYTSKLYVDEMAPLVLAAARSTAQGILNLGGPRTTLEAYARRTRPEVETIARPDWVPADTSLDLTKMKEVLGISDEHTVIRH